MTIPFRPAELSDGDEPMSAVELAEAFATARELESAAMAADARPSVGFADRILAAVAAEPLPRPMARIGWAVARGRLGALMVALADTWRLAWSGGRPLAARAQALAVVVVLVVAAGAMSGLAVVGVAGLLNRPGVTAPSPSDVAPSIAPSPSPSNDVIRTPEPSVTAEPTSTPRRSTPAPPTVHPTETPEGTDDHGGKDGSGSEDSGRGGESEGLDSSSGDSGS
jgi:hypothetical protein